MLILCIHVSSTVLSPRLSNDTAVKLQRRAFRHPDVNAVRALLRVSHCPFPSYPRPSVVSSHTLPIILFLVPLLSRKRPDATE